MSSESDDCGGVGGRRRGAGVMAGGGGGAAASRSDRFAARTTSDQSAAWSQSGHGARTGTSRAAGASANACRARQQIWVAAPQRSHLAIAPRGVAADAAGSPHKAHVRSSSS